MLLFIVYYHEYDVDYYLILQVDDIFNFGLNFVSYTR